MIMVRWLALIFPLLSLAAVAQTPPDPALSVPPDHIRIPVFVSDKKGNPVADLREEDFRILDNGKPAPIAKFLVVSAATPAPAHFTVFYLDDRHIKMDQMIDARKNIAAALTTALDSNGYAAIVTGTGSINSGFSRDPVELRKTLDSTRTTTFAAEGPGFHNFDIIGTYSSLVDYASRMSRLPGRRLLVVFSPGFSSDLPEIRSAAAFSIDRIIQSGVVLNAINTEDSSSGSLSSDNVVLDQLTVATGGTLFPGSAPPSILTQYPECLYLLDISLSSIRADGSLHQLKVAVSKTGSHVRARSSFVAPSATR